MGLQLKKLSMIEHFTFQLDVKQFSQSQKSQTIKWLFNVHELDGK